MVRWLLRDLRENKWMWLALTLAIATMAAVSSSADRLRAALADSASALIGADAKMSGTRPLSALQRQRAAETGLAINETVNFPSMIFAGPQSMLVSVRAVSPGFPLRGTIRFAASAPAEARLGPRPQTVWIDERVRFRLGLKRGDTLQLGDAVFVIAAEANREPGAVFSFSQIAPRVWMSAQDLDATGLVTAESRVVYDTLLAGSEAQIQHFRKRAPLRTDQRWTDARSARPEIDVMLNRVEQFLTAVALLAAVLALATLGLTSQRYVEQHADTWALMKCWGAQESQLLRRYAGQWLVLGLLSLGIAIALGEGAQRLFSDRIETILHLPLPPASIGPSLITAAYGIVLFAVAMVPPLWALNRVPAWQVLRRISPPMPGRYVSLFGGLGALFLAAWLLSKQLSLAGLLIGIVFAVSLITALLGIVLLGLARRFLVQRFLSVRLGLAPFWRSPSRLLVQLVGLTLTLLPLLLIGVIGRDLVADWQQQLPSDTPNYFAINLQPEQRAPFEGLFRQRGLNPPPLFPTIRARLTQINSKAVDISRYTDGKARQLANRDFNLSWLDHTPDDNVLVAGPAFTPNTRDAWSITQEMASSLGLKIGDTLTFDVAGQSVTATIRNLRTLRWQSFRTNFFVIASPDLLSSIPGNYMASFYLSPAHAAFSNEIVRALPNVSIIDVAAALSTVADIVNQLIWAVLVIVALSVCSGICVLFAALRAGQTDRTLEVAILRTLGLDRRRLQRRFTIELAAIGGSAGLAAVAVSELVAYYASTQWLDSLFSAHWPLWALTPAIAAGAMVICGQATLRQATCLSPAAALRA